MAVTRECPECGKVVSRANLSRHRQQMHGVEPAPPGNPKSVGPEPEGLAEDPEDDSPFAETRERVPGGEPASKPASKWWQRKGASKPKVRVAPKRHPRADTSPIIEHIWQGLAQATASRDVPVSRVLAFQAPFVGGVVDDAIKGTLIDKPLQPLARLYGHSSVLGGIVGTPIIVGMIERRPELHPVLVPVLHDLVDSMLIELAKGAKKEKQRQEKQRAALEELEGLLPPEMMQVLRDENMSPADALIEMIFADMPSPEETTWNVTPTPTAV